MVGEAALILKTTDGGNTWVSKEAPTWNNLFAVSFIDTNNAFAIGDYGVFLKSTDGGESWISQVTDEIGWRDVSFTTPANGIIIGADYTQGLENPRGIIYSTIDGGTTWNSKIVDYFPDCIDFPSLDYGTLGCDYGDILRTTDSGLTWDAQSKGIRNNLNDVFFMDNHSGIAVGSSGTIIKTSDGGTHWIEQSSGTKNKLNSVFFADINTGIVVGDSGIILKTTNGGMVWEPQNSGVLKDLKGVYMSSVNNFV